MEIGLGATAGVSKYEDPLSTGGTVIGFAEQKIIKILNATQ
jgi:hypothetical protein